VTNCADDGGRKKSETGNICVSNCAYN